MTQLGACAAVGVPALDVIRASPDERALLMGAAVEARDFLDARDDALAERIIAKLADALRKGKR